MGQGVFAESGGGGGAEFLRVRIFAESVGVCMLSTGVILAAAALAVLSLAGCMQDSYDI